MKEIFKGVRFWMLWVVAMAILGWYWATDPDGGAETMVRLQWLLWLFVAAGPAYLVRKALMPGDSKTLLREAAAGSVGAGLVWLGMALLTGLLFLAFAGQARAGQPPQKALEYLPVLQQEAATHWPDAPLQSALAAQVEQETCPSLTHRKCWNPRTELKTDREYGFGLGQLTVTSRFDNFAEARKLSPSLRDWQWEDRYDATRQLRTMVLMDRAAWRRFSFAEGRERLAMALAAYNGGAGGVLSDRRVCAAVEGCDPNKWFGHVEQHSLKAKVAAKGYGKSFFEINREYPRNILGFRRDRYAAWFGEV
jgi:hypothetical protein